MKDMAVELKAKERTDFRRSANKAVRNEGFVPSVVYGKDKEAKAISVNEIELVKTVRDEGRNAIISLDVENGETVDVMLHDYQMDSLRNELIHADFYVVDMSEEMEAAVPLVITGEAKGAKAGGVLQQPYFELTVLAKPRDIPEEITADVTELEIGDSLTVAELPKSPEFSYVDDEETAVVTVTAPEVEKEPVEGEDENVEPELVDAKEEEDEE